MSIYINIDAYAGQIHRGAIPVYVNVRVHCMGCGEHLDLDEAADEYGTSVSYDSLTSIVYEHEQMCPGQR